MTTTYRLKLRLNVGGFGPLLLLGLLNFSSTPLFADPLTDRYNYAEALQKTQLFYEAQRSGNIGNNPRLNWVGSSYINDGADVGRDLSGGLYDAGDTVKWNDTMSFAASMLAWGAIEHRSAYVNSGQLSYLKSNLQWVDDYFVDKCFVDSGNRSTYRIYTQIMDPDNSGEEDHSYWAAKEVAHLIQPVRHTYYADASAPQSDIVSNMAAALAASSIVFRMDGDTVTADKYLTKAERLFDFANFYRAAGTKKNAAGAIIGNASTGFYDDLLWSAAWLHRAELSKNSGYGNGYLTIANQIYDLPGMNDKLQHWVDFGYGSYSKGAYVLLWKMTADTKWKQELDNYCDWWIPEIGYGDRASRSPGRLAFHTNPAGSIPIWGSLRQANNQAWIWFQYSDNLPAGDARKARMHDYAVEQVNYALGSNPLNRAYLIGFNPNGKTPTVTPHHRTAHGTWRGFDWSQAGPDQLLTARHTLYGALIGGPDGDDSFPADISDPRHDEVALDYNAGITNNLARMFQEYGGGSALANFPVAETPTNEFASKAGREMATWATTASGYALQFSIENHTAWPARATTGLKARYFFTLDTGASASQVTIDNPYNTNPLPQTVTGPTQWNGNVYYLELSFPNSTIYPAGNSSYRVSGYFRIKYANGATCDASNDWSIVGLGNDAYNQTYSPNIPVYDSNGVKLYGNEPPAAPNTETPSLIVSTLNDTVNSSDNLTSLREAMTYAATLGSSPTITFLSSLNGTLTLNSCLPRVTTSMNIEGPSSGGVAISGNNAVRLFNNAGTLAISNLTLRNGKAVPDAYSALSSGGGMINDATSAATANLTLRNCSLVGSTATVNAGAILNRVDVSLTNCTANLKLENCTLSSNVASGFGGAIRNSIPNGNIGRVVLVNCTLTSNNANNGGALANYGTSSATASIELYNCTLASNTAGSQGSAIFDDSAAGRVGGVNMSNALLVSETLSGASVPSNSRNYTSSSNAGIGVLANNGGIVQTMALSANSPARDAGVNSLIPSSTNTDARAGSFARISGTSVDIGAFEYANIAPIITASSYSAAQNNPFSQQLPASDANGDTLSFVVTSGTLPSGIALSSSGLLNGTPSSAGSGSFGVTVSDGHGASATGTFTLNIVPSAGTGTGLEEQYYTGLAFNIPVLTRTDPMIDFGWGYGSPAASIGDDNFSVRWTGKVEAIESGTYTFKTTTDDGVKLWVNNTLLIDKWVDQAPTSWSGSISLSAGQKYDLTMEYYERGGGAEARLAWQRPGQSISAIIPQIRLYPAP